MRQRVVFKGQVQGVGFRYTAALTARGFQITGYVRNLPDGTVELVAEGERAEVSGFITEINGQMRVNICSCIKTSEPETGEFIDFSIRYKDTGP